jgi:ELWxxDGT repeat protein
MKFFFFMACCVIALATRLTGQVTRINSNGSLHIQSSLNNNSSIFRSEPDSLIWVSDGTLAGTSQLSTVIKYKEGIGAVLSGKLIFPGNTAATGTELYVTDGTPGGTILLSDINSGTDGSDPSDFTLLNGFVYFTASTPATGRELWRTNGVPGGTTLVKDIQAGPAGSFTLNSSYHIFSNGVYLLFAAGTTASGNELWISDGSGAGTLLLKEINTGNGGADSSNPSNFFISNNLVLFTANDGTHGVEFWATDGTPTGTTIIADINAGAAGSTSYEYLPGVELPVFQGFHAFNNWVYFNATDGAGSGEIWRTDGTPVNTTLVKDVVPGFTFTFVLLADAENLAGKFIFPVADAAGRSELWESDGSSGGTQLFKTFTPVNPGEVPLIFISPLFQGSKFFFAASTTAEGYELWVSDGTLAATHIVKDINPGSGRGIDPANSFSYLYTTTGLFFSASNGSLGNELWKTDGTAAGTVLIQDINAGAADANPASAIGINSKIIFTATDGDSPTATDLYAVNGTFAFLPVTLGEFTATLTGDDALIAWTTEQELNTQNFMVQRSFDGLAFENIGTVHAVGNSGIRHPYSYTDAGIARSGNEKVYYRLRTTDLDGKTDLSKTIDLKLNGNAGWSVNMVSNPVTQNSVMIAMYNTGNNVKISIHDISGKLYYSQVFQKLNGILTLPVTLQAGMYLLEVENKNSFKTIRFIKQ